MSARGVTIARRLDTFVNHPVTDLVKGLILLVIGLSEASRTLREDINHGHVRVGHGLILIGLFSILGSLPHVIEGLAAGSRYLEGRAAKDHKP